MTTKRNPKSETVTIPRARYDHLLRAMNLLMEYRGLYAEGEDSDGTSIEWEDLDALAADAAKIIADYQSTF